MFKKSVFSASILLALSQITACSSSDDDDKSPEENTNVAPTAIYLTNLNVTENEMGSVVGTLSVLDEDSDDSHTYTTSDARFTISNTELSLAAEQSFNFEKEPTTSVEVTVTDSANNSYTQSFDIIIDDVLDTYSFGDSVSYSGQVARHLLILELTNYISSGLQADLDNDMFTTREEVLEQLLSLYRATDEEYDLVLGDRALTVSTLVDAAQNTLKEVSASTKDLSGKIAGNDATGQHQDWSQAFVAFGAMGTRSPEQEIERLLGLIADNAAEYIAGNTRLDPNGNAITSVYLAEDGLDYKQLVQKILLGAVAFSQGADDYLDDDTEGKGLLSDHVDFGSNPYTALEHQFDEGFGYFGAARDYLEYSDDEISVKGGRDEYQGMHDSNADGEIDFKSEYNFGHSQNAAKRDRGTASNSNPTDFTKEAMEAFIAGRKLLNDTAGTELSDAQMTELQGYRDTALMAWEKSIAATAVHYINDTIADLDTMGTDDFVYADLAKHWSELKGFVISLQFNRMSPLTDAQHLEVNSLIADAPVLTTEEVAAYKADLEDARDILQAAYQFDAENVANW